MVIAIAFVIAISVAIADSVAITIAIAHRPSPIAVAVGHCHCSGRQPLPPLSLLRCHQPLPLLSPLLSAITVAIFIDHHHRHRRWPFLRVVALAQQELYLTILRNKCLPYFILFGQWAVH
jgi:hypothetical protein